MGRQKNGIQTGKHDRQINKHVKKTEKHGKYRDTYIT